MKDKLRFLKAGAAAVCAVALLLSGCELTNTEKPVSENPSQEARVKNETDPSSAPDAEMPNISGKPIGEATDILDDLGLEYEIVEEYVGSVEKYTVISQEPKAGSPIESGMTVKLVVCAGDKAPESSKDEKPESKAQNNSESKAQNKPESKANKQASSVSEEQKLPDLVGMNVNAATQALDSMGIYYTGTYQFDDSVPKGQVISQDPAAGTAAPKGSRVTFIISDGKQPEQQEVTYEANEEQPQQNYTPSEELQHGSTEPATEPDMSGVQKFLGSWYSFRPYATITDKNDGTYEVEIIWSSSAMSAIKWHMFAEYDPDQDILTYDNGSEIPCLYDSRYGWVGGGVRKLNLCGYFRINGNGELQWYDERVEESSEIVFTKS